MFSQVYFEISSLCNAKCYWCQTGQANLNKSANGNFVSIEKFKKSIEYMLDNKFIQNGALISLYNWGEPLLHPKLKEIIKYLTDKDLKIIISTNASKLITFEGIDELRNLESITYSMCGFSQNSYDKIHGFDFEKIKSNIVKMTKNFKDAGFKGTFLIAYHIYQFNVDELIEMIEFARENDIQPMPSYAYINDFKRMEQYINKEVEYEYLYKATSQLILFPIEEALKHRQEKYSCPQYLKLSIDSNCNVITCCADSTVLNKIYHVKSEDINEWRIKSEICKRCNSIGQSYVMHNPAIPKQIIGLK